MTKDEIELLKRRFESVIWNQLRNGGLNELKFTVGDLIATATYLNTDDNEDEDDKIAGVMIKAVFGIDAAAAYETTYENKEEYYVFRVDAGVMVPRYNKQRVRAIFKFEVQQKYWHAYAMCDITFEYPRKRLDAKFYDDELANYAIGDVKEPLSITSEIKVTPTECVSALPVSVPHHEIGLLGMADETTAECATRNGYEWLQSNILASDAW